MEPLTPNAGPDTGLPPAVEVAIALLFYTGPLLLGGLGLLAWRGGHRGRAAVAVGFLAASIYTEAAFLDLACGPGEAGCSWLDARLWVAAVGAALALAAAVLVFARHVAAGAVLATAGTALGLYVTLGYLLQPA